MWVLSIILTAVVMAGVASMEPLSAPLRVFHLLRFASPQGTLLPLTPHDSWVVYCTWARRRVSVRSAMPPWRLFEVVPNAEVGAMHHQYTGGPGHVCAPSRPARVPPSISQSACQNSICHDMMDHFESPAAAPNN